MTLNLNPKFAQVYQDTVELANKHNIKLNFVDSYRIKYMDLDCKGYFTEPIYPYYERPELAIGIRDKNNVPCNGGIAWFDTWLHETSHMDQYLQDKELYNSAKVHQGVQALDLITLWVDKYIEIAPEKLHDIVSKAQKIEWDAEKRTIEKIRKYQLEDIYPIDKYAQNANTYLYLYRYMEKERFWGDEKSVNIYEIDEIVSQMPTTIGDFTLYDTCPYFDLYCQYYSPLV